MTFHQKMVTGCLAGGHIMIKTQYSFIDNLSVFIKLNGKTDGWNMGNPYLNNNVAAQLGLSWNLVEK
jgi:hypothetical protein